MSITGASMQQLSRVTTAQGNSVGVYRVRDRLVYRMTSDATTNTDFKYLFRLFNSTNDEIAKAYITANPAGSGMVDISPYVRELVSLPSEDVGGDHIHKGVNDSDYLTKVEGAAKILKIVPGEVYDDSGTLTEFPDTGEQIFILVFNGAFQLRDKDGTGGAARQDLTPFCSARSVAEVGVKGFLSTVEKDTFSHIPRAEYLKSEVGAAYAVPLMRQNDKDNNPLGQLAWLHDSTYFDGESNDVEIKYYDDDDNLLYTLTIDATLAASGGQALNAQDEDGKILAVPAYSGSQDNNSLISTLRNLNANAWDYYTIQIVGNVTGVPPLKWVFFNHCADNRFNHYQIAWDNGIGFYDYYTFHLKSEHTKKVETKNYSTNHGTWAAAGYTEQPYDRNTVPYKVKEEQEYKLFTGKIPEATARYLKGILSSRKIDMIDDLGNILPVVCTDSSLTYGVDTTNSMRDYSFTFKLAQYIDA